MGLFQVRGGFTVAMGASGVFTSGDILDLTPEQARAWVVQIEPATEAPGKRVARPRPKPAEKLVANVGRFPTP